MLITLKGIEIGKEASSIHLLRFGQTETTKGEGYVFDKESADILINNFQKTGNDIVIDYEHQTLEGREAPAAGWIKELFRGDDGLYGSVEWTERGLNYIKGKEYRYLSPVLYIKEGKPFYLQSVALTNLPATIDAKPLINKMESLDILEDNKTMPKEILEALGLQEGATLTDAVEVIKGLSERIAELEDKLKKDKSDEAVKVALKEGKITPAQVQWASEYAHKDPEGFYLFISKASRAVPLGETVSGLKGGLSINPSQRRVNALFGIDDNTYEKYQKVEA